MLIPICEFEGCTFLMYGSGEWLVDSPQKHVVLQGSCSSSLMYVGYILFLFVPMDEGYVLGEIGRREIWYMDMEGLL